MSPSGAVPKPSAETSSAVRPSGRRGSGECESMVNLFLPCRAPVVLVHHLRTATRSSPENGQGQAAFRFSQSAQFVAVLATWNNGSSPDFPSLFIGARRQSGTAGCGPCRRLSPEIAQFDFEPFTATGPALHEIVRYRLWTKTLRSRRVLQFGRQDPKAT